MLKMVAPKILHFFLGARIIKTGITVFIVLAAFHRIGPEYATFAAVASILAVQPSATKARKIFTHQLLSNLIGGAVGVLIGLWLGSAAIGMALGVVLVLGLCSRFGLTEAASLAVVVVLFVMQYGGEHLFLYSLTRVGAITGGMLIGHLVNRFIYPPRFKLRLRQELQEAADAVQAFGSHLAASLASPEHYAKPQIKSEARAIQKRLEGAGNLLEMYEESEADHPSVLPLIKMQTSLFVFIERIMDMHKIALQMGGMTHRPEEDLARAALASILRVKKDLVKAALADRPADPDVFIDCTKALQQLELAVQQLIADPNTRARGLLLHGFYTNIQHMSWRMESLWRLLPTAVNRQNG